MTYYLVSCEHASGKIPRAYSKLFSSPKDRALFTTHRALDLGALAVAQIFAQELHAPLFVGTMSRLIIDLNRSPRHPDLFSRWTKGLDLVEREALLASHSEYRASVLRSLKASRKPVIHLSIHSFTPVLHDEVRETDIGLLYDPKRASELGWAKAVQKRLVAGTDWVVHRNAPYRGVSDGHTKSLRAKFSEKLYQGIEIEINQRLLESTKSQKRVAQTLLAHI